MPPPDDLQYTRRHEWVRTDGGTRTIGVTEFVTEMLGDIVSVQLPTVGDTVTAGDVCGEIESTMVVCDLSAPVTGTVTEINTNIDSDPGIVGADPYGEGWLFRVGGALDARVPRLLDAAAYRQRLQGW